MERERQLLLRLCQGAAKSRVGKVAVLLAALNAGMVSDLPPNSVKADSIEAPPSLELLSTGVFLPQEQQVPIPGIIESEIIALYQAKLGRTPDSTEVAYWLRWDLPRAIVGITNSPEAQLFRKQPRESLPLEVQAWQFREYLLSTYPFKDEAKIIIRNLQIEIDSNAKGGGWYNLLNKIVVPRFHDEEIIHEFTHAIADYNKFWVDGPGRNLAFRAAFNRLALERPDAYPRANAAAAFLNDPQNPWTFFMEIDLAQTEMEHYAVLAAFTRGDRRELPPYLRQFYNGVFR